MFRFVLARLVVASSSSSLASSRSAASAFAHVPSWAAAAAWAPSRSFVGAGKTKSSVKKRFRVNGGGQIVRQKSGKRHLNIHKSASRLNRLGKSHMVTAPGIRKKYLKIFQISPLLSR